MGRGRVRIRVLVYNVRGFRDGAGRVANVVQRLEPDIVLMNESGGRLRLRRFARTVGMRAARDPWSPLRRRVKDAVLLRPPWRLVEHRLHRFTGSARWYPRGALIARAERPGIRLWAVATHLGLRPGERRRHARELAEALGGADGPILVGGDLNEFPGRGAAEFLAGRFRDVWHLADDGGSGETFPAEEPTARIDYLFVSEGIGVERAMVPSIPEVRAASDHRPLVVDLSLSEPAEVSRRSSERP